MITNREKAQILLDALPFIKKYAGKTIVIKYGGSVMTDPILRKNFMQDIVLMKYVGIKPVIVHGGGQEINRLLEKLGKQTTFIGGNRVTDQETVDVVEMVLSGKVNKNIVSDINVQGGKAIGLSGKDNNLVVVRKKYIEQDGQKIDIGFVGEITKVNYELLELLCDQDYIPVISSIGVDDAGQTYNINADYVAGEIAATLKAERLIFLTDVDGILRDHQDKSTLIREISKTDAEALIHKGIINGGMLPKVATCLHALQRGVENIIIINGKEKHSIILELFTEEGLGTLIHR